MVEEVRHRILRGSHHLLKLAPYIQQVAASFYKTGFVGLETNLWVYLGTAGTHLVLKVLEQAQEDLKVKHWHTNLAIPLSGTEGHSSRDLSHP
jgi:Uri superfamily endonuclease